MSRIEKSLQRFLDNPSSLHFHDIEKILFYFGFERIEAKGSHKKFKHSLLQNDLIIPVHNNDCKNFYKISAQKIIKEIFLKKNHK